MSSRRSPILFLIVLLMVLAPFPAFALMENRPTNTSAPALLKQGHFQFATGGVFLRQPNRDKEWDWVSDLEYGVFDWLEYDLEIPRVSLKNADGLGDVAMTWAINPIKESEYIPIVSLAFTMKTQSGDQDRGLGTGKNDYTALMLLSKQMDNWTLIMNLGYKVVGKPPGENLRDTFSSNFSVAYEIAEKISLVGEIYGETNPDINAVRDPWNMLGGAIYKINDSLTMDFGVGTGFNSESPSLRITSGFVLTL